MQSQIQMKAESIPGDSFVNALPPGGELVYIRDFLARSYAEELFATLIREPFWQTRSITMFGRTIAQPRKIAFQGDPGVRYTYSGDEYRAEAWHPDIAGLRKEIESEIGCRLNCVLLNLYRDGRDSMGWHSDDEEELGSCPTIASVSLGEVRRFLLREKADKQNKLEIKPASGSLMIMRGDLQHYWQHALPKTARPVGPRINLTFREIVPPRIRDARPTP